MFSINSNMKIIFLWIKGDSKKAREYLFSALELRTKLYRDAHPDVATTLTNIGMSYFYSNEIYKCKLIKKFSFPTFFKWLSLLFFNQQPLSIWPNRWRYEKKYSRRTIRLWLRRFSTWQTPTTRLTITGRCSSTPSAPMRFVAKFTRPTMSCPSSLGNSRSWALPTITWSRTARPWSSGSDRTIATKSLIFTTVPARSATY